jgi:DNA-binding NarL/FixJ family response regulator
VAGKDLRALREALHHRHAAALPSLALAIRLARSQQRTLLGEEGLSLLARIADSGAGDTAAVVELNREVASLASELAQYDVALERWQFVAEHAREQEKRAAAFVRAARASLALNGAVEARRALDRARAEDVRDEFFQLELDSQAATVGLWSGDDRAPARAFARAVVDRAHRLYASTDRDHLDARKRRAYLEALRVEYDLAYQEDDVETLLASSKRRAAVARSFDLEAFLAATIAEGRALRRMCRLGEAEQRLRSALDEAHRAVLPQLTIDAAYWLASALELTGRVAEAEQIATEAVELAARAGDEALGRHSIERLTYKLSLHRGDWAPALEGMRAYAQEASAHARIELYGDGALWLALVGGRELESESLMWLADARACAEQAACPRCSTELRLVAAEVLARSGRAAEATTQLTEWQALQRKPEPRDEVARQRVEALATDNGSAAARLEATVRLAARSGLVLEALWTQLDLARALAATERARAIEISRDVAAAAADLGALTEQQVAEQLLRSLGVRTWRRRGLAGEPLTKREREIAQLVAAGASNPEIGRRLFLSRKTVERHVSNIFKKLGVRNRAELAAKATELKLEGAPR